MEGVLLGLAVLACPVGMGVMMWVMMRSKRQQPASPRTPDELRAEHARITAELERRERSEPTSVARS